MWGGLNLSVFHKKFNFISLRTRLCASAPCEELWQVLKNGARRAGPGSALKGSDVASEWAWGKVVASVPFLSSSTREMGLAKPVILKTLATHCYHLRSFKNAATWPQPQRF